MIRLEALVLPLVLCACGSEVSTEGGSTSGAVTATVSTAGSGGAGGASQGAGGQGGQNPGNPGKPCTTDNDCPNPYASCLEGHCCTGALVNHACRCGDGPGCNLTSTCCRPIGAAAGVLACEHSWSECQDNGK